MPIKRFSEEFKEECGKLYQEKHLKISEIAKKKKVSVKTLYRWEHDYKWLQHIQEQAKTMYLEEKTKIPEIAKKLHSDRKRGWGLQLMRELMDDVQIESGDEGTVITMIKKR